MNNTKKYFFFIPVICGIFFLLFMIKSKRPPQRPEAAEISRPVSTVEVKSMTVIPRVKGYGYVEPTETWEAIPEVSGLVVEVNPELRKGAFVTKGELLLRIDPVSYGLAESRGEASVLNLEAQLRELDQEKKNIERLLENEKRSLELTLKEVKRKRVLATKDYISPSELEKEEKIVLAQQTTVDNLANSLALIPAKKNALLALKDSDESSLSELRLDIEKTVIRAPFDCRISEVDIELNEYAAAGKTVIRAINIDSVEIPVQLSPGSFVNLLSDSIGTIRIGSKDFTMDTIRNMIGIKATVRLPMFSREAVWHAKFERTSESIDLDTGAMTAYISVDRPYEKIKPGVRPPLVSNMYCEVILQGSPREERYVIPLFAVHEGYVYVVNQESRLQKKEINIEMVMGDMAVIKEGFHDGVQVITTDLVPAIEGQLLEPFLDKDLMTRIETLGLRGEKE